MKEKKFSFVVCLWWCLGLMLLGGFLLAFAPKEGRESYTENRMLAGFPVLTADSVLSGSFMAGMESYLSDGFFGRDGVIALSDGLKDALDQRTEEERFLMDDTEEKLMELVGVYGDEEEEAADVGPYEESNDDEPDGSVPSVSFLLRRGRLLASAGASDVSRLVAEPADSPKPAAIFDPEQKYSLVLNQKDGGALKVYAYSEENMRAFADTLNLCRSFLPEDGTVNFCQVPISTTARRWTGQRKKYAGWRSTMEDGLQALAGEGVRVYNAPELLSPAMENREMVYFNMDHHWTPLGAYYVFAAMIRDQGYPVLPYDEYEYELIHSKPNKDKTRDQLDVLNPLLPVRSLIVTHWDQEQEIPFMNSNGRTYVVFMNNTQTPWRRVITGFHTGRKALVICDSFGNAFTPFLLPYYDEVHMTDPRNGYYSAQEAGGSMGEMIRYHGIDDIYVVLSTANGVNSNNGLIYFRDYLTE